MKNPNLTEAEQARLETRPRTRFGRPLFIDTFGKMLLLNTIAVVAALAGVIALCAYQNW